MKKTYIKRRDILCSWVGTLIIIKHEFISNLAYNFNLGFNIGQSLNRILDETLYNDPLIYMEE